MKHCLSILLFAIVSVAAYGQDDKSFDEFRKNALSGMSLFRDSVMTEYKEFRRRINADYADFLRGVWKEEKSQPAPLPLVEPVPIPPVVFPKDDRDKPIETRPIKIEGEIQPIIIPAPQPQPIVPIEEEPPTPVTPPVTHKFDFYGTPLQVRLAPNQRFTLKGVQPQTMGNAWERLSQDDYTNLLYDCLQLREDYTLCDWAFLLMINRLAESFLGAKTNEATLLTAYIYCQCGYRIRLGEYDGRLYLLVGTPHQIYHHGYYVIDGLNYFVFNANPESLNICNAEFEGECALSLYIPQLPKLKETLTERRTLKSERYPDIAVASQVNKSIIDFFNDYPTSCLGDNVCSRWAMYAQTPLCTPAERTILNALRTKIQGLPKTEALNRLLNFVQTAFVYEYDDKVWGGDRAFFADETLYYPYCDCEDRSILLTRLVRDLLGLKCALLYYPGHLATAIAIGEDVNGDYIRINGTKFLVCDPTYIGAPIGVTMPGMDNKAAKVIVLE